MVTHKASAVDPATYTANVLVWKPGGNIWSIQLYLSLVIGYLEDETHVKWTTN